MQGGGKIMKKVVIAGAGENGAAVLKLLAKKNNIHITAIIDHNPEAPGAKMANAYNIPVQPSLSNQLGEQIDIIIDATGNGDLLTSLKSRDFGKPIVIPVEVALELIEPVEKHVESLKSTQEFAYKLGLTFDHMPEGIITINENGIITYVNQRAEQLTGITASSLINNSIREKFSSSRLLNILQSRKKEINQKVTLANGREVICDYLPLIDKKGFLHGALAIYRDLSEVYELIEKVSDLKDSEKLIEAIFQISNEGISVADEYGIIKKINRAYTMITGYEEDIIGSAAFTLDEMEENFHQKVLNSRKPIYEAKTKAGTFKKDVRINAVPLIVNGKLRGSLEVMRDVSNISMLKKELNQAKQMVRTLETNYTFEDFVKVSSEMKLAVEQAKVGANSSSAILLKGEQGTGTEILAQAIHNQSNRKNNKFIRLNCCSIDEETMERDWFGNLAGSAFLTPSEEVKGYFEQADKGTIFLEEIGELSLPLQDKLFSVLEKKEIPKDDLSVASPIDVRFIASTSANLEKNVIKGQFREYLYDRLNRLSIYVPPLRERNEDFSGLIEHTIDKINVDYGKNICGMEHEAVEHLKKHSWPGNLREMEIAIRKAALRMNNQESVLLLQHFSFLSFTPQEKATKNNFSKLEEETTLQAALDQLEERMIFTTLQSNNWNKTKTAEDLGVSIRNLYYKMKKYHILKENAEDFS